MKVNLISFQDKAVKELRKEFAAALYTYRMRNKTQVISLQAPTGAGKTIIAAALIESVYFGMTLADGTTFDEQPEAIFVWLSDSPELNEQSKQKIELKTDKLRYGQCVTISEESFDMEMLEDGHIYFLNTQKISRSGKLTQHSDDRQYTIWETLNNTIVFFKEALSTGWDCPRAETMMSFAVRNDPTYIAQLLGRMVRTPLQMRVQRDEFLNDVKLYLPHFDKDTVKKVVDELQSNEGGEIPTEINGESLEEPTYVTWTVHTPGRRRVITPDPNQMSLFDQPAVSPAAETPAAVNDTPETVAPTAVAPIPEPASAPEVPAMNPGTGAPEYVPPRTVTVPVPATAPEAPLNPSAELPQGKQLTLAPELDRVEIIDFINAKGYLNYYIRQDRINDYLKSLLDLANLLTHNAIYLGARDEVIDDVIGLIRSYVEELHRSGRYDTLAEQVLQFKLSVQVFDPFGEALHEHYFSDFTMMSETDLDRQVRNADAKLGRYGFPNIYGGRYYDENDPNAHKIDCVLFAADETCRAKLGEYAKEKLRTFSSKYRVAVANRSDDCKRQYRRIMMDSTEISEQIFAIPENIVVREDADGIAYENHLLASPETGIAKIKLNGWEAALIEEEAKRTDFVCWLRNQSRASWALCLPYEINGETKSFYPDFLIVRSDPMVDYVVDILEPHGQQYTDNLPKAKALAEYAKKEDRLGRIQLIHKTSDAGGSKFIRLDLTDIVVQDKVLRASNDDELNNIFTNYGHFE